MIDVKNISFKYAGQKDLVFDDFSLSLEANRIYGLLGKNGTGKSTLLSHRAPKLEVSTRLVVGMQKFFSEMRKVSGMAVTRLCACRLSQSS